MSRYRRIPQMAFGRDGIGRRMGRGMVRKRSGGFRVWPILLFAGFGVIYYFSNSETNELTGRRQMIAISEDQEIALGLNSYNQILSQAPVVQGGVHYQKINEIGQRIAASTGETDFTWEFNLIDSDQANAFALPGGKVAVYSGILPIAKNEDGLAVIMGHEVAHAIARHGAERMAHQQLKQWGTMAMGVAVGEMDIGAQRGIMGAFGVGAQFGAMLPFSRKHESEADYMGLIYVARSCYNPEEAPKVWERMAEASSGNNTSEFASTHPSPRTRIEQFREWMPEALEIRKKFCGDQSF